MRIKLDRVKKAAILQAIKDGYIESEVLHGLAPNRFEGMTDEELKEELIKVSRINWVETCELREQHGLCLRLAEEKGQRLRCPKHTE